MCRTRGRSAALLSGALAAFYQRWNSTPLVLDKWFAVQARSAAPETLARVQTLSAHEKFDMRNPNRVRALIANFTGNAAKFHDASGAGNLRHRFRAIQIQARPRFRR